MLRNRLAAMLLLTIPVAHAQIYRCENGGKVVYTDRACHAGAEPLEVPDANAYEADGETEDLVKAYDRRMKESRAARNKADAKWLKAHKVRREREARIRAALIDDEVVAGMNAVQVRQVWGEPARVTRQDKAGVVKETWVYRNGKETRTVNFKDGEVTSASRRKGEKKKTR